MPNSMDAPPDQSAPPDKHLGDSPQSSAPAPRPEPFVERSGPLFILFLAIGLIAFIGAFLTVHHRDPRVLTTNPGAQRSFLELSHWLADGYFHNCGLLMPFPLETIGFYRSSTGGSLLSTFVLQKLYTSVAGGYSWRLVAWHNQLVVLLLATLTGLLAYRITRKTGLPAKHGLVCGAAVLYVVFTFPANLWLYWELSSQAYALLFVTVYLLIEERCEAGGRTRMMSIAQAGAVFLSAYMGYVVAVAFLGARGMSTAILEQPRGAWRRFLLSGILPCLAALGLYAGQLYAARLRFPDAAMVGTSFMTRSGLDGESLYYLDHLDIAKRRDVARLCFPVNRPALFRWPWVFALGSLSVLVALAAFIVQRLPRIAVETLTSMTGTWVLYAAVFSEAVAIHPYLYDVLLFVPLVLALFCILPALAESLTRRTGAFVLVVAFCACWYSFFQLRIYALWFPMPGARSAPAATTPVP